ncbi:MAG: hypothetical protein AAF657_36940 [Acidobacteriota bacterium]
MKRQDFERRLRECQEMPGADDPAYWSAYNAAIKEAGGSISSSDREASEKLDLALEDDKKREWSWIGSSPMDARLAAFSDLYLEAQAEQRQFLQISFTEDELDKLLHFIARAGLLVEASGDSQWLKRGLAAACIEGSHCEIRETLGSLSLLRFGAERAGIDTGPFFLEAVRMLSPSKPRSSTEELILQVMDYPEEDITGIVRMIGPPTWQDELGPEKPWWKFW